MNGEIPKDKSIYQYNELSAEYASLADIDPSKRYVQYPEALRLLGDFKGKKVLDIGCGNGTFTRMLARRGASVVGYDPSEQQVRQAQQMEQQEHLGILYFISDRPAIKPELKFDKATSVMVLPYAADKKHLGELFSFANEHLADGGEFSSVIFNPNYKRLGQITYNRRFTKTEDGKIQVEFLDEKGSVKLTAKFSDFSSDDYEVAAKQTGFQNFEWKNLSVMPEGIEAQGKEFWSGYEEDCPYIGLVAGK